MDNYFTGMKKLVLFTALAAAMCGCAPETTITVENTLGFDRAAELVEIPVAGLGAITLADGQTYVVKNAEGEVVPSQVTSDGLLLFQSGLGANAKATFTVTAGAPREFAPKTCGRFAPERMDDFIWENDRVAFRIYGAALVAKDGPSNGLDVLYKRTDEMILDKWYEDDLQNGLSYHDDHGTGLDNFDVKRTLGGGAAAPLVNGTLVLNSNFTGHEVLDNGPLRTSFRLTYPDITIDGASVKESRTFSIDAGSQLTRVTQEYGVTEPITVAVGYTKRNPEMKYAMSGKTMLIEEPATAKASGVYLGAVMPAEIGAAVENEYTNPDPMRTATYRLVLATQTYTPGMPLTYYTGFGWEKWGDWTAESFAAYLANFAAALKTPFAIMIND
jgi:hypothetical protein